MDQTEPMTTDVAAFEHELKNLLIEALMLEDVTADDIDSTAPLFETLGLDSIDALEISMIINKQYGVHLQADDERNRRIFATLRSLAEYVLEHRKDTTP